MYDELILIRNSQRFDENGNPLIDEYGRVIPSEFVKTKIPAEIMSCGQSEFFKAGQAGFKPEIKAVTFCGNYTGEEYAEFKGVRYKIYRTFLNGIDMIELYLTKKLE